MLITFANSLNLDQARQNVGPDLDPNCLTLQIENQLHVTVTEPGAVGNVSGYRCESRGREFDLGSVPYFRGD